MKYLSCTEYAKKVEISDGMKVVIVERKKEYRFNGEQIDDNTNIFTKQPEKIVNKIS